MKISKAILMGIFCPLYLFVLLNLIVYAPSPFAEILSALMNVFLLVPAVFLTRFLISPSLKEFFKKLAICFCVSFVFILVYLFSKIDLMLCKLITGYDELSLGYSFGFVFIFEAYIISSAIGSIIAAVFTWFKQKKKTP